MFKQQHAQEVGWVNRLYVIIQIKAVNHHVSSHNSGSTWWGKMTFSNILCLPFHLGNCMSKHMAGFLTLDDENKPSGSRIPTPEPKIYCSWFSLASFILLSANFTFAFPCIWLSTRHLSGLKSILQTSNESRCRKLIVTLGQTASNQKRIHS